MATNTTNYGWTKPDYEDDADIAVLNETFDAIDEQVKTVETALGDKADTSTTYTKTEVDTALSVKANSADVYSKTAVDTALDDKADKSNTYTKTEVDTALNAKADVTDIPTVPITAIQKNGTGITPVSGTVNITVPTQASDINAATATQGDKADTAIQGIKVNSTTVNPDANKVVNITVPTSAADVSALPDTTKYAAALSLTINSSTYVMTGQLKDQNGDNLGTAQTIDLPLESVVVGGSYNSQTKKVVLTLQNGNTIEFSVADLVSGLQTELSASNKLNPAYIDYDSAHRAVSDTEKSTWNGKQDALTTSQLAAINSGITAEDVSQIETNKNNISTVSDANGTKNLLDFNDWASKVNTTRATKSISKNSITLTATGRDAYTDGVAATCPASGKIACEPNTTYVITWETTSTSTSDNVYIFPANASPYYTAATTKYIEYTMPAGCKYFTFRFGVANSGDTVTYSNIMICEKSLYDISNQYKSYALSNAELTTKEKQNENNILLMQSNHGVLKDDTTLIGTDWTLTSLVLEAPVNSTVFMSAALLWGAKAPRGILICRSNTSPTTGVIASIEVSDDNGQISTQGVGVKLNGVNTYYVWAKAKEASTNVPTYLFYDIH